MRIFKIISINLIIFIATIELGSYILTKANLFLINEKPKLYNLDGNKLKDIEFGRTEKEAWGTWHKPNNTFRQSKSCFDIEMSFNEVGARDKSFIDISQNTIILLGDSFAEGYGVSYEQMVQTLIEQKIGINIANLGSANNFGPLQELIIYKNFKKIPHSGLIIFILPANDFTDNDSLVWSKINKSRYRPYFNETGDSLIPFYFPEAKKVDQLINTKFDKIKKFIKNNFWLSNALRSILLLFFDQTSDVKFSFYYDITDLKQQLNLAKAYKEIINQAEDKDVLFVIIPSEIDILRHREENFSKKYKNKIWYKEIQNLTNKKTQKISILDLLDFVEDDYKKLFFKCDSHWSPYGNKWASNKITDKIIKEDLFSKIKDN